MTKTKVILVVAFLLAFAAGTALGLLIYRPIAQPQAPHPRSELALALNLTAEQQEQMGKVWAETRELVFRQHDDKRSALALEREQQVLALFDQTQRAAYEAIQQDYARKSEELSQEGRRAFEEVRKQTRLILSAEQAAKYDEWLRQQRERGGPGGFRGPRHRHPASAGASRPIIEEQSPPRVGE